MKRMLKVCIPILLSLLMLGCAAPLSIKESALKNGYDSSLKKSVFVLIEVGYMDRAFSHHRFKTRQQILAEVSTSAEAISAQFQTQLKESGVDLTIKIVNENIEPGSVNRVIAQHRNFDQILILNAHSFGQSVRMVGGQASGPAVWDGNLSWRLRLYDGNQSSANKEVWSVFTNPHFISNCQSDAFRSCAQKLSEVLVARMKEDKILRAN